MRIVHIAGMWVRVGDRIRQRCAWCGDELISYELNRVMVPLGVPAGLPATWEPGELVAVDGHVQYVEGGARDLPADACAFLPEAPADASSLAE